MLVFANFNVDISFFDTDGTAKDMPKPNRCTVVIQS